MGTSGPKPQKVQIILGGKEVVEQGPDALAAGVILSRNGNDLVGVRAALRDQIRIISHDAHGHQDVDDMRHIGRPGALRPARAWIEVQARQREGHVGAGRGQPDRHIRVVQRLTRGGVPVSARVDEVVHPADPVEPHPQGDEGLLYRRRRRAGFLRQGIDEPRYTCEFGQDPIYAQSDQIPQRGAGGPHGTRRRGKGGIQIADAADAAPLLHVDGDPGNEGQGEEDRLGRLEAQLGVRYAADAEQLAQVGQHRNVQRDVRVVVDHVLGIGGHAGGDRVYEVEDRVRTSEAISSDRDSRPDPRFW